jgi:hypothetical protein
MFDKLSSIPELELRTPDVREFVLRYNKVMFETVKQLLILTSKSKKIWIVPIILLLIIIALLVINAQISPLPIFIYPII